MHPMEDPLAQVVGAKIHPMADLLAQVVGANGLDWPPNKETADKYVRLFEYLNKPCHELSLAKVGKFAVSEVFVREQPGLVMELMTNLLVVGCVSDFATRTLLYTAISHSFREINPGENIPSYTVTVATIKEEEGYSHSFSFEKEK